MARTKHEGGAAVPFEEALKKLAEIVRQLEAGDVPLEDSLKVFEEGIQWTRVCEQRLTEAKGRVELLVKQASGDVTTTPFPSEG